jgi:signal transduction histidine kinase
MQTQRSTPRDDAASFPTSDVLQPGTLGLCDAPVDVPARLAQQAAQIRELRAEADQLRADRDRLAAQQRQIAELLKSGNPDKLIHDLRNVLNELQLYKMLADTQP